MTELHVGDRVTISFVVTGVDDDGDYRIDVDSTDDGDDLIDLSVGRLTDHQQYVPSGACIPEGHIVRAARRPKQGDRLMPGDLRYLASCDRVHYLITASGLPIRFTASGFTPDLRIASTDNVTRFADGSPIDWTVG